MAKSDRRFPISPLARRLGTNLRTVRRRLGWSQTKVAIAAGISLASYSRIETGKQLPALPRIDELATVLGVPLTALLLVTDEEGSRSAAIAQLLYGMKIDEQDFVFGLVLYCAQQWRARSMTAGDAGV